MKNLRHGSLGINVIYGIPKVQSWGHDSKLDFLIQKIKVGKMDYNSYCHEYKSHYIPVYTT